MTFASALRDAVDARASHWRASDSPVPPAAWLAAASLDAAGARPEDLLVGTTLIYSSHDVVREGVAAMLREIYRGAYHDAHASLSPRHQEIVVAALPVPERAGDWYHRACAVGAPVVVVACDPTQVRPQPVLFLAVRSFLLEECGREIVARFVEAATGGHVDLPEDLGAMAASDLVLAVPAGATPAVAAERIRGLLRLQAQAADDARYGEEELDRLLGGGKGKAVDAEPIAVPAARVVRKLSEMTGFGDAGTWGLSLAADLRDHAAGKLSWSDVDRGILLSGPPGSGKTTFAAALALEAGVDLVPTTYSDWHGASAGDSVNKSLQKLFQTWRDKAAKQGPFILLIDEIDSIGRRGGNGHSEGWFVTIINSWLAFLDGAISREGIIVVAATNHPDRVDPALLRAGRLDRHVDLPYPGIEAMRGVVRHHLGADAVVDEEELATAARACRGMSPAQVEQVCREARRLARRIYRRSVAAQDVADVLAAQRMQHLADPRALAADHRIAVHEAGHAVATMKHGGDAIRLESVDLDQRQASSTVSILLTRADVERRVVVLLAGMTAEEAVFGCHSNGAGADLAEATRMCLSVQTDWAHGRRRFGFAPS